MTRKKNLRDFLQTLKLKVPIRALGILHISNLWIILWKIVIYLIFRKFYLRGLLFALKVHGSDAKSGICLVTPGCFNIQTSRGFENFCLFSSNSTYSVQNQVIYLSMSTTACFHCNTDSWIDFTSVNLTVKKSRKITFSQKYPKITNM